MWFGPLFNATVGALTDIGAGSGLTGDLRYCATKATSTRCRKPRTTAD